MLVVEGLVLQFEVFELFVLSIAIAFEEICEIIDPFTDFFVKFLKLCFGALFEFFELHLKLALLFTLVFE